MFLALKENDFNINQGCPKAIFCILVNALNIHIDLYKEKLKMARPKTKEELIAAATIGFNTLWRLIESMTEDALTTEFDFSGDVSKKEDHWKRDKNLRDVLIHLYEWHQLLLIWVESNMAGNKVGFLPEPYNWKNYREMNREFCEAHQSTSLESAKKMLKKSHKASLALIAGFSDQELFTKQFFNWTGTTSLGSYCVSATSSHYDWAIKKLRVHIRKVSQQ